MHEAEGGLDGRPHRGRLDQAAVHDVFELLEFRAEPLFPRTRFRLTEMAESRSRNFSPLACKGGRPSSVMAERTAEQ